MKKRKRRHIILFRKAREVDYYFRCEASHWLVVGSNLSFTSNWSKPFGVRTLISSNT